MDKSLQRILGVKKLDDWMLPGARSSDAGKVIYVFLPNNADPFQEFERVTSVVDPPIVKRGAVFFDAWLVKTPDGEIFYPLYFHGDLEGWRQEIERGATELGLKMAKLEGNKFMVSGGPTFLLTDCTVTLDGSPYELPGP